ncbi:MAG: DUF4406 domain-containing protein [Candidatus Peribacteraceae bacterium]|nr:DUF4406 domain-containing protein [Candidatus Peribacteraceae bacterium]
MRRTVIYLACPMTKGNWTTNVRQCLQFAEELFTKGYTPIAPVLTWFWDIVHYHSHEDWLEYAFGLVAVSDAVLRVPGVSEGADMELDYAVRHDIPIYTDINDLYKELDNNVHES